MCFQWHKLLLTTTQVIVGGRSHAVHHPKKSWMPGQWPFQDPKLEVPTIYKAYVREYPSKIWPEIWYSTSILGSWNSHWPGLEPRLWGKAYLPTFLEELLTFGFQTNQVLDGTTVRPEPLQESWVLRFEPTPKEIDNTQNWSVAKPLYTFAKSVDIYR